MAGAGGSGPQGHVHCSADFRLLYNVMLRDQQLPEELKSELRKLTSPEAGGPTAQNVERWAFWAVQQPAFKEVVLANAWARSSVKYKLWNKVSIAATGQTLADLKEDTGGDPLPSPETLPSAETRNATDAARTDEDGDDEDAAGAADGTDFASFHIRGSIYANKTSSSLLGSSSFTGLRSGRRAPLVAMDVLRGVGTPPSLTGRCQTTEPTPAAAAAPPAEAATSRGTGRPAAGPAPLVPAAVIAAMQRHVAGAAPQAAEGVPRSPAVAAAAGGGAGGSAGPGGSPLRVAAKETEFVTGWVDPLLTYPQLLKGKRVPAPRRSPGPGANASPKTVRRYILLKSVRESQQVQKAFCQGWNRPRASPRSRLAAKRRAGSGSNKRASPGPGTSPGAVKRLKIQKAVIEALQPRLDKSKRKAAAVPSSVPRLKRLRFGSPVSVTRAYQQRQQELHAREAAEAAAAAQAAAAAEAAAAEEAAPAAEAAAAADAAAAGGGEEGAGGGLPGVWSHLAPLLIRMAQARDIWTQEELGEQVPPLLAPVVVGLLQQASMDPSEERARHLVIGLANAMVQVVTHGDYLQDLLDRVVPMPAAAAAAAGAAGAPNGAAAAAAAPAAAGGGGNAAGDAAPGGAQQVAQPAPAAAAENEMAAAAAAAPAGPAGGVPAAALATPAPRLPGAPSWGTDGPGL